MMKSNIHASTSLPSSNSSVIKKQDKIDKIAQSNLKKIQQHISTYYSNPSCSTFCQCQICQQKYQLVQKGKQFLRQTSSLIKIDTQRIKQFYQFMSSVNKKCSFRLNIPTLCFFQKGQCKLMFKSKNQYITQMDGVQVAKRNVANFFVQANRKKNDKPIDINKDNHIKHFSQVIPSYIHGTNQGNSKMKQAMAFFFHKDTRSQNDTHLVVQAQSSQQVAIVKYHQNKGYQLLNQKQLRLLLKSPSNTICIDFIQSYIKPHQTQTQFLFSQYYGYSTPQNQLMWIRSQTQIRLALGLLNKYSKDYVPIQHLQAYQEVLKEISDQYILYQTYKMVHYMQIVRDLKINHLNTIWLKDQSRNITFFGILSFQHQQIQKADINFGQIYGVRQMIDKPFTQLEEMLMEQWNKVKSTKINQSKINNNIN